MKKHKWLSLALALVMCLGLTVPALAVEPNIVWMSDDLQLDSFNPMGNGLIPACKRVDGYESMGTWGAFPASVPRYGYVDRTGKIIIPMQYDCAYSFHDGLAIVGKYTDEYQCKDMKYGFVNTSGQEVVPCEYDWVLEFSDGMAAVYKDKKYGFVNKTGQLVIPIQYDVADYFYDGETTVRKGGNWFVIDKTGKEVLSFDSQYSTIGTFYDGLAVVTKDYGNGQIPKRKYGFIDRTGKEIVAPTTYDTARDFSNGRALVGITDPDDPDGYLMGFIDTTGKLVIPMKYDGAIGHGFSEGIAIVGEKNGTGWGGIDPDGNTVIPFKYGDLGAFHDGLARAYITQGKEGFIDKTGKVVVPFQYASLGDFSEGSAFVGYYTGDRVKEGILTLPGYSAPTPTPAPAPTVAGFTDVAENSPFKDAIAWAVEKNITKGTTATTFGPSTTCTHNHILTFLWRANGSPAAEGANDFAKAAAWARSQGLLTGGSFDGTRACTRSETMVYLWKLAGSPETAVNDTFTDVAADADYAQAVAWAVAQGVTKGVSAAAFGPDNSCTRGQIVTFLYRSLGA